MVSSRESNNYSDSVHLIYSNVLCTVCELNERFDSCLSNSPLFVFIHKADQCFDSVCLIHFCFLQAIECLESIYLTHSDLLYK